MKKSLFVLGVAVAALASCTNEEVVSVPEGSAIQFSQFVNNNTKAVTPVTSIPDGGYYVIGWYGDATGAYTEPVFTNETNTTTYYWMAGKFYKFASYYDGGSKITGAAFNQAGTQLTLPYTAGNNDLVAAISDEVKCENVTGNDAVGLNFKHLLSQVGFTFNTKLGGEYTLAISDLKVNAIKTSECTYDGTNITWVTEGATKADYEYAAIADLADGEQTNGIYSKSEVLLVIPQAVPASGTQIAVTFTANLIGDGIDPVDHPNGITKKFSANLTVPTDNAWKAGYIYNYTTELTAKQFDEDLGETMQITFDPSVSDKWENGTGGDFTVTPVQP